MCGLPSPTLNISFDLIPLAFNNLDVPIVAII